MEAFFVLRRRIVPRDQSGQSKSISEMWWRTGNNRVDLVERGIRESLLLFAVCTLHEDLAFYRCVFAPLTTSRNKSILPAYVL